MPEVLLSIILPVYNVEHYLRECLDSVYSQNLEACEVICVNDGSTDGSRNILEEYRQKNPELIIIDRENAGLIVARNTGYKIAKGEYIYYLDSDDYLLPGVIRKMLGFARTNELDVALFNSEKDTGKMYYQLKTDLECVYCGKKYFREFYLNNGFFPPSVQWMYLYKKEFLDKNKIHFPEDNLQEDEPFTVKSFFHASRVSTLDIPIVYHRVLREGSITQTAKLPHLIDALEAWEYLYNYLHESNCNDRIFYHKIFNLYQSTIGKLTADQFKKYRKGFLKIKDFKIMRQCAIDSNLYKFYWYYRYSFILFNWYTSGIRLPFIKKVINRSLSAYYKVFVSHE